MVVFFITKSCGMPCATEAAARQGLRGRHPTGVSHGATSQACMTLAYSQGAFPAACQSPRTIKLQLVLRLGRARLVRRLHQAQGGELAPRGFSPLHALLTTSLPPFCNEIGDLQACKQRVEGRRPADHFATTPARSPSRATTSCEPTPSTALPAGATPPLPPTPSWSGEPRPGLTPIRARHGTGERHKRPLCWPMAAAPLPAGHSTGSRVPSLRPGGIAPPCTSFERNVDIALFSQGPPMQPALLAWGALLGRPAQKRAHLSS